MWKRRLALLLSPLFLAAPALAQETCEGVEPYLFILLDTSGSMNWSPKCTQTQFDAGECAFLCPTGDCYVPLQGDDPNSKFHQLKDGLQTALANETSIHFGFATFNQDELNVRAKHWIYEAAGNGVTIPGWGPYPAAGAREFMGYAWGCDTGNGDHEIGCYPAAPADLNDPWELTRVQRVSKGGVAWNQIMRVYLRNSGVIYKVTYQPASGVLGSPAVNLTVRIDRCNNAGCSSFTQVGQQTLTWNRVAELLSWDNAGGSPSRTNPQQSFFNNNAADASAGNTCSGWDPNTDTTSDPENGYNLRWPTDTSDLRGPALYMGDVIPLDWLNDHNLDIQKRLAPNLVLGSLAPDFRTSPYLRDSRFGAETFLRLKDERARPLIASGSTPLGNSLASFSTWLTALGGWADQARVGDPSWTCRRISLLVLTDGDETCGGNDACAIADNLNRQGVPTYVVAWGMDSSVGAPACMASSGGTGSPFLAQTRQELIDALTAIFTDVKAPI